MTKLQKKPARRPASFHAEFVADEAAARGVANFLVETLDPGVAACGACERPDGRWQVDLHFTDRPDPDRLRALVAIAGGDRLAATLSMKPLAARDWVRQSLVGLRPVTAGRFVIHGVHDRDRVPHHCVGIEIEAGTAFGTGHHGTTRGCLLALDTLARVLRPRHILDLGTGSGVLAIAAAKIFHAPVLAIDIDAQSVRTARANAEHNGVGALVTAVHGSGLHTPEVARRAPFDLVLSNILLRPLQRLAAPMARQLMPNARVVLSGVLAAQASAVLSAYRSQGLMLERSFVLDGWFTPVMVALCA